MSVVGGPPGVGPCDVLLMISKATSELDFALPVLWKLRQERPDLRIKVLYCALNQRRILRRSEFYSREFSKLDIQECDFGDFLASRFPGARRLARKVASSSPWDTGQGMSTRLVRGVERVLDRFESRSEDWIDVRGMFRTLRPRVVFYALRHYQYPLKGQVEEALRDSEARVVLYPHGGFNSYGYQCLNDELLTPGWEMWIPQQQERTFDLHPELQDQLFWSGYPGLDSEWLDHVGTRSSRRDPTGRLRCLFLIRPFRVPTEYGVLGVGEFRELLSGVVEGLRRSGRPVELVVKPHPSNNFVTLESMLRESGYPDWRIAHDAVCVEAAQADFVVTVPSTSMLVPLLAGVPVLLANCSFTKYLTAAWDYNREVLEGVPFAAATPAEIPQALEGLFAALADPSALEASRLQTLAHYRAIYPDQAALRCIERLGSSLGTGRE